MAKMHCFNKRYDDFFSLFNFDVQSNEVFLKFELFNSESRSWSIILMIGVLLWRNTAFVIYNPYKALRSPWILWSALRWLMLKI